MMKILVDQAIRGTYAMHQPVKKGNSTINKMMDSLTIDTP